MPEGLSMKSLMLLAASALPATLAAPALAQDHSGREGHMSMPMPMPAPAPTGEMDHSQMDHAEMDREADTAEAFHQLGTRLPPRPVEASGTSRLPGAEGMMPGVHFDIGDGWMGMAHGYLWGIY